MRPGRGARRTIRRQRAANGGEVRRPLRDDRAAVSAPQLPRKATQHQAGGAATIGSDRLIAVQPGRNDVVVRRVSPEIGRFARPDFDRAISRKFDQASRECICSPLADTHRQVNPALTLSMATLRNEIAETARSFACQHAQSCF